MKNISFIPLQHATAGLNTSYSIELASTAEAQEIFLHARHNLLHVNKWHGLSGPAAAWFQLTDQYGNDKDREVIPGDFLRIKIPATSSDKTKFDWVIVENVEEQLTHYFHAWTSIKVRPASPPVPGTSSTANILQEQPTSIFIVERKGTVVKACVLGRNEKVNAQSQGWLDTMRMTIVAFAGIFGFNKTQWKNLVKGIICDAPGHHHLHGRKTA